MWNEDMVYQPSKPSCYFLTIFTFFCFFPTFENLEIMQESSSLWLRRQWWSLKVILVFLPSISVKITQNNNMHCLGPTFYFYCCFSFPFYVYDQVHHSESLHLWGTTGPLGIVITVQVCFFWAALLLDILVCQMANAYMQICEWNLIIMRKT